MLTAPLYEMIDYYTREAGVRNLERLIASVCRKAAVTIVSKEDTKRLSVTAKNLSTYLGPRKFRDDELTRKDEIGVANGLAWTSVGGEMLQVECAVMEGSGKDQFTGLPGRCDEGIGVCRHHLYPQCGGPVRHQQDFL